jgi:hypothetical protein
MERQKNNERPGALKKETELQADTDYRGIAGSASLNATKKEIHAEKDKDPATDNENPLTPGGDPN